MSSMNYLFPHSYMFFLAITIIAFSVKSCESCPYHPICNKTQRARYCKQICRAFLQKYTWEIVWVFDSSSFSWWSLLLKKKRCSLQGIFWALSFKSFYYWRDIKILFETILPGVHLRYTRCTEINPYLQTLIYIVL